MDWKTQDAYCTQVVRLQEKYRRRDEAVSRLLDREDRVVLMERTARMREKLRDSFRFPGLDGTTEACVTGRCEQDGYAIENVVITGADH